MSWFRKQYQIVEVASPRVELADITPDLREGLKTLVANPFFQLILDRLRMQRYALETRLKQRFANVEDIGYVQNGVFWTGWLERELERLTEAPPKPHLEPVEQEIEAFRVIDSLLERVGTTGE
jgi:hypothetical protein